MPNIWPTTEEWEDGSPAAEYRGYYSVVVDDGTAYQYGALHDGYEPSGGFAAATRDNANGNDGKPIGFVRREEHPAEISVRAVLAKRSRNGTPPDADAIVRHGIIARMTGAVVGPLNDTGNPRFSWMEEITAYSFEVRSAGSGNLKLGLYRWDLGVEQVLIESSSFPATAAGWNLRGLLQLQISNNGSGNPVLTGSVGEVEGGEAGDLFSTFSEPGGEGGSEDVAVGGAPPSSTGVLLNAGGNFVAGDPRVDGMVGRAKRGQPQPPVNPGDDDAVTVLSWEDTDVNKITAGGRCGFIVDDEQDTPGSGGGTWGSGCESFQIVNATNSTTLWLDVFERAAREMASTFVDAFATPGRDLTCDWSADYGGVITGGSGAYGDGGSSIIRLNGQTDFGNALDVPGTAPATATMFLNPPASSYSALPPGESVLELSLVIWANLDTSRDGNCFYHAPDGAAFTEGIRFRWLDQGSGQAALQVELRDADGTDFDATSSNFTAAGFLNATYAYGFTYKANAFSDGTGRLRLYRGRQGNATLLDEIVVPLTCRPTFQMVEHRIGDTVELAAPAADRYLDGTVDRLSVFYDELSATAMDTLMDEACTDGQITALGAVHSLDFEDSTTDATYRSFPVWLPATASQDWRIGVGDGTLVTGLVTTQEDAYRHLIHRRPSENVYEQARSVEAEISDSSGRAGVVLLGSGISHIGIFQMFVNGGSYYRVMVGVGSPAPVWVDRVVGGVPTLIARENAATSTANVAAATQFTLLVSCRKSNPDDLLSANVIALTIDGTAVPLVLAGEDAGLAISTDDHVVDSSDERVVTGDATGILAFAPTGQTTDFDSFALASLIGGAGAISPGTLRTVQLPFEADTVSGDLGSVLTLEWGFEVAFPRNVDRTDMEDNRVQQQGRGLFQRRVVRVSSRSIPTEAELDALRGFFLQQRGREVPFNWSGLTNIGEATGVWRFRAAQWRDAINRTGGGRVAFEIEECAVRPAGLFL